MPLAPYVVKATTFFGQGGNGWTESYWWQGQSGDAIAQAAALLNITNKRRVLLGAQSSIRAYRVSYETDGGGNMLLQDSELNYYGQTGFSTEPSDVADDALLLEWKDATGQRRKFQFMRGLWDASITSGGAFDPNYGTWNTKFTAWLTALNAPVAGVKAQSVGWIRRTPYQVGIITNYVSDDNGNVVLTLAAPLIIGQLQPTLTGLPLNTPLEATIKGVNNKSTLNGTKLVRVADATHVVLVKPLATLPFRSQGTITFYDRNLILVGTDPTSGLLRIKQQKIVERKVGAPLLESRGRRRVQVRA